MRLGRRYYFRQALFLCVGTSLIALIGWSAAVVSTMRWGVPRDVGRRARNLAIQESAAFPQERHRDAIEWLEDPSVPTETYAQFLEHYRLDDPAESAIWVRDVELNRIAIESNDVVIPIPKERRGDMLALGNALDEVVKRHPDKGVSDVGVTLVRGTLLIRLSRGRGDWPFVRLYPLPTDEQGARIGSLEERLLRDRASGYTEEYRNRSGSWVSGFAPLPPRSGGSPGLLEVDMRVPSAPFRASLLPSLLLAPLLPSLLVAILGSVFFANRLATRIDVFVEGLRRVKRGDFDVRLPPSADPQVNEVTQVFNEVVAGLAEKERMTRIFEQAVSKEVGQFLLARAEAAEGEMREATVLFADVRGFTSMSEEMTAREVVALLNEFFAAVTPAIGLHGGIIDKFMGDGVMAVFGVPSPLENDALAATRAAFDLTRRLSEFNRGRTATGARTLEIGIGVNTGPLMAGTVGAPDRRNYTVLGQTVNVASRICAAAAPGQILISQSTWLRVRRRVEARAIEPLTLKGVSVPVAAYELVELRELSRDSGD